MERRLAAVLVADIVGYSRLMNEDEEGTLRAVKDTFKSLINPKVAQYRGRIIKLTGDGALMEFASAVDAVAFAVEVQCAMRERNREVPEERRIEYRIGINIGDIIIESDDIYGDGVNIAARLEGLADPGGICVARNVFNQVKRKLDLNFEDLGEKEVKNISDPVSVYRTVLDDKADSLVTAVQVSVRSKSKRSVFMTAGLSLLVLIAGLVWWRPWAPSFEPASVAQMAYSLPELPSVVVLPFANYSDDPKLKFFARGLTENLTTALSKAQGLFVIARNSAATYKGKSVKVKRVAEELGIRYVLEGSVQKAGDRLRITVQLIDALTGNHMWADQFDRQARDIFDLQDEITLRVFEELQVKLTDGDRARVISRGTNSLDARLLGAEAYGELIKWTREGHIRALKLFEDSHNADPKSARALGGIATIHYYAARRGWSVSRAESIRLGRKFAERAIQMDPNDPIGYQLLGAIFFLLNQPKRAIELRQKAIQLAPNDFSTVAGFAMRLKEFGQEQKAVELFRHAMRLSPKHPWWVPFGYGLALHLIGKKEEAVQTYKKTIRLSPKNANTYARLAAVYVDLNNMAEAKAAAAEVLRLNPKFVVSRYQKSYSFNDPKRLAWYKALLLRAGLPE